MSENSVNEGASTGTIKVRVSADTVNEGVAMGIVDNSMASMWAGGTGVDRTLDGGTKDGSVVGVFSLDTMGAAPTVGLVGGWLSTEVVDSPLKTMAVGRGRRGNRKTLPARPQRAWPPIPNGPPPERWRKTTARNRDRAWIMLSSCKRWSSGAAKGLR